MSEMVSVRLSPALLDRLDEIASRWGLNRAMTVRRLIENADVDALTPLPVPTMDELVQIAAERARSGSMSAIHFLAARQREDPQTAARRAFDELLERQS